MPTVLPRRTDDGIPGGENDGYRSGNPPVVGRGEDSRDRAIDRFGPQHGAAERPFGGGSRNRAGDPVARRRPAASDPGAPGSARGGRRRQPGRAAAEVPNRADSSLAGERPPAADQSPRALGPRGAGGLL